MMPQRSARPRSAKANRQLLGRPWKAGSAGIGPPEATQNRSSDAAPTLLTADTGLDVLMRALLGDDESAVGANGRPEPLVDVEAQLANVMSAVGLAGTAAHRSAGAAARAPDGTLDEVRVDAVEDFATPPHSGADAPQRGVRRWFQELFRRSGSPMPISIIEVDVPEPSVEAESLPIIRPMVSGWLGRLICALHGHDHMLTFEQERMFLRCTSCGHESPGWTRADQRPVVKWDHARRPASVAQFAPARRAWIVARPKPAGARRTAAGAAEIAQVAGLRD